MGSNDASEWRDTEGVWPVGVERVRGEMEEEEAQNVVHIRMILGRKNTAGRQVGREWNKDSTTKHR